jgi:hypothetical protein
VRWTVDAAIAADEELTKAKVRDQARDSSCAECRTG